MKANELRIGNLVLVDNPEYHPKLKDVYLRITGIYQATIEYSIQLEHINQNPNKYYDTYSQFMRFIKPIALTEEWLLKFGFKKVNDWYEINYSDFNITIFFDDYGLIKDLQLSNTNISGAYPNVLNFQYVHQLQNLYFALAGNELELIG